MTPETLEIEVDKAIVEQTKNGFKLRRAMYHSTTENYCGCALTAWAYDKGFQPKPVVGEDDPDVAMQAYNFIVASFDNNQKFVSRFASGFDDATANRSQFDDDIFYLIGWRLGAKWGRLVK